MQNDEWVHYLTIDNLMNGNLSLHPYVGSTFYTQGFMGLMVGALFGVNKISVLTWLISLAGFILLIKIIRSNQAIGNTFSVLLALIIFLNPLFIYGSLGFMTDNYFLFFMLLWLYLIKRFSQYRSPISMTLINITLFMGFFVKQSFIIFFLAAVIWLFINGHKKKALFQLIITFFTVLFYQLIFPKTSIMVNQSLQLQRFFDPIMIISFLVVLGTYLGALLFPIFGYSIWESAKKISRTRLLIIFILSVIVTLGAIWIAKVYPFNLDNFPYLPNTFGRKGFSPYSLSGNKYHWQGFYDLFNFWSFIGLLSFVFYLIIKNKTLISEVRKIEFFTALLYGTLILTIPNVYDRYLTPLIVLVGLLTISGYKHYRDLTAKVLFIPFILFLLFLNYQYCSDFILVEKYIWEKAKEISVEKHIPPDLISATHAWNYYYNVKDDYMYKFSYDKPEIYENPANVLVESKTIEFPLNIFIEPKVYLYKSYDINSK